MNLPRKFRCEQLGFTLIEILVVVLIISILMGVVVNSFGGVDREQTLRGYVERFALRIEIARDRALQSNREWGVHIDEDGVRFTEFDELNNKWVIRANKPFNADSYDNRVVFTVVVEEFEGAQATRISRLVDDGFSDQEDEVPSIVLFSSGETTPFEIVVEPSEWETTGWMLKSDGFTRTSVSRAES